MSSAPLANGISGICRDARFKRLTGHHKFEPAIFSFCRRPKQKKARRLFDDGTVPRGGQSSIQRTS